MYEKARSKVKCLRKYLMVAFLCVSASGWSEFFDGFEDGITDAWTVVNSGGVVSSEQAHDGTKSFKITGQNFLKKDLGSSQAGVVTAWYYDTKVDTSAAALVRADDGVIWRSLGVHSSDGGKMAYYTMRIGDDWLSTGVPRTAGWHEFKWDYTSGFELRMYIDGIQVHSSSELVEVSQIGIGNAWGGNLFSTVAYFDDVDLSTELDIQTIADSFPAPVPGGTLKGNVKDNDLSAATADAVLVDPPVFHNGVFTLNSDGSFAYTRTDDGYAEDSFTYKLRKNDTDYNTVTVSISGRGLVHYYKLDEDAGTTASDEAPVGAADGAIVEAIWGDGIEGSSGLVFDGSASKVKLGTSAALTGTTDFTLSAWIKTTANAEGMIIQQRDNFSVDGQYRFAMLSDGTLKFSIYNGGYQFEIVTTATVNDGEWHNVIAMREGGTGRIYVDGYEYGTGSGNVKTLTLRFVAIGYDYRDNNLNFNGTIDEVAIYNYALSVNEINRVATPAIGIKVAQAGNRLTWTVGEEIGIKEYQIVDAATGEVIEVVVAGNGAYSTTLPEGVEAKLVVVDNSGYSQTFLPDDGNILKVVYDLKEGWNLIAMTGDNAETTSLEAAIVGDFWAWNGIAYEATDTPKACQGIWVYAPKAVQTVVTAEKSDVEIELDSGWSLVGPKENIKVPDTAHAVYGWNETYQELLEGGIMIQGIGYWVFSL